MFATAVHAHLVEIEIWCLVRSEEYVVMGGVFMFFEHARKDVAAEMVIASRCEVAGAEDFFVLNVGIGNRKDLGAEAEFSEGSGHGVFCEAAVVGVDGRLATFDQGRAINVTVFHIQHAECAVFVFHRKLAIGIRWDKIDFAGWKVRDIRLFTEAEPV